MMLSTLSDESRIELWNLYNSELRPKSKQNFRTHSTRRSLVRRDINSMNMREQKLIRKLGKSDLILNTWDISFKT